MYELIMLERMRRAAAEASRETKGDGSPELQIPLNRSDRNVHTILLGATGRKAIFVNYLKTAITLRNQLATYMRRH